MAAIVVLGSLNEDLVVSVARWPEAGETMVGTSLLRAPGGKGANQAVAAARLGGEVAMIGRIGDDESGRRLRASLEAHGVDASAVTAASGTSTGTAIIGLEPFGANRIVVLPGANGCLTADAIADYRWDGVRILLLQLEVPVATVRAAARAAHAAGATVVLDPAPVQELPADLLGAVDILTPNAAEATALSGRVVRDVRTARLAASQLATQGPRAVIVTLGAAGAVLAEGNYVTHAPAPTVAAVDTTGAGDVFNGALAVATVEGQPLASAILFATRAAALSTTRLGAQASVPDRAALEAWR